MQYYPTPPTIIPTSDIETLFSSDTSYPPIETALHDGYVVRGFQTASFSLYGNAPGIRVVRIENVGGPLVGYGEATTIDEALGHAALDYILGHESYNDQYLKTSSRHMQQLIGRDEPASELDAWIKQEGKFYANWSPDDDFIFVSLRKYYHTLEIDQDEAPMYQAGRYVEDRGITYYVKSEFSHAWNAYGISKIVSNPFNKNPWMYVGEKLGKGALFAEAVQNAFISKPVEIETDHL